MTLYVLRHAIAEEPAPGMPDSDRRLTSAGRDKARRVLEHARRIGLRPGTILTSPYARARQTAEIACRELRFPGSALESRALVPYATVDDLWSEIRDHAASGETMVVGHNPLLSSLVAWLLGARGDAFWLKKSGLAALDVSPGARQPRAALSWLLTPGSVGR